VRTDNKTEALKLADAAKYVLDECRMVLPGIQALFGFQMISVFNPGFAQRLTSSMQKLHGVAIFLVVLAIAFVMAPAALHRRAEPRSVSEAFLRVSSRLLLAAMFLLAVGLCLDVFIVTTLAWRSEALALGASIVLFCVLAILWEAYPTLFRRRHSE
jgi:hypothetical protein